MTQDKSALSKEDLYLLIESYRNMIELNTTLVSQHNKILEVLQEIKPGIQDAKKISQELDTVCENLNKLIELNKERYLSCERAIVMSYTKLRFQVQIIWFGITSIVLGLIGLLVHVIGK